MNIPIDNTPCTKTASPAKWPLNPAPLLVVVKIVLRNWYAMLPKLMEHPFFKLVAIHFSSSCRLLGTVEIVQAAVIIPEQPIQFWMLFMGCFLVLNTIMVKSPAMPMR